MEAFNDLRRAARERRDRICKQARDEYESTLARIAGIEQDLLGRDVSTHQSIMACVTNVLPADHPFTIADVLGGLEVAHPARNWPRRSVEMCIFRLRRDGLIWRVSKAKVGRSSVSSPAVYARAGVVVKTKPFADATLGEALFQVLQGRTMRIAELIVALLEGGYLSNQPQSGLRACALKVMRADRRFKRVGERWGC